MTQCKGSGCQHGCKPHLIGPLCFCKEGTQPNGTDCIGENKLYLFLDNSHFLCNYNTYLFVFKDADECTVEGSCDQLCSNTNGSYSCDCINGYRKEGQRCYAINGL